VDWKSPQELKTLTSPSRSQVLKVVAKLYLDKLGARRLVALDYRTSEKGEWGEPFSDSRRKWNIAAAHQSEEWVKLPSGKKLENSYFVCSLVAQGRGDQSNANKAINRLNELQNLLPKPLAEYDETQLNDYASRMINHY